MKENKIFKLAIFGVIIFFVIGIISSNCFIVKTGEVAIISKFGKVEKVAREGLNFKMPFIQSKERMEIREKTYHFLKNNGYVLEVSTKDMQTIIIELSLQASISDPEKLYRAFNGMHEERYLIPRTREVVQAIISKYTIEEFISKRTEISMQIQNSLKTDFTSYGITLSNTSIINHDFSDDYERAIEQKKIAEQAVERAKAEQEKLAVEAENKVKLAEYALKEKELQARANTIESNSLSPQLLKKMTIEKWNGELPKVNGTNNSNLISID